MDERDEKLELTRRTLIGAAAGAAALAGAAPLLGEAPVGGPPPVSTAPHAGLRPFELAGLGLADLRRGLESGRFTARRLAELYIERIAAVDRGPDGTHAVAEVNPDSLALADQLDAERRAGRVRGPLHGLPILVKDNIGSADGMETTAGSLALLGARPEKDAFLVRRLRESGALLLGKTNLSEWANFRSTRSTSGWSGRGGQVRNPHALDRNPCGSSSGSGVAAAADLCAAAVGTETDGSITCPAAMNGVVGLKPTVGLISRSGVIPISHTQDTAGPMGRTVEDVALLLGGLAGADLTDPATAGSAGHVLTDYTRGLDAKALAGARLGVVRSFFGWHPEIERQAEDLLGALRAAGAVLVDPLEIPNVTDLDPNEFEVMLYEFKHGLNAYLAQLPDRGQPRTLSALIEFNRAHAREEMPWFGQELFEQAEGKGPLTEEAYKKALETALRQARAEGLDAAFAGQKVDALVCPTLGPAYPIDWINGDHYGGSCTSPPAVSGYPHLTVPAGFVHGLPWGFSFLGPAWSEAKLLAYGHAFELATRARRAPAFLPTLPLEV